MRFVKYDKTEKEWHIAITIDEIRALGGLIYGKPTLEAVLEFADQVLDLPAPGEDEEEE